MFKEIFESKELDIQATLLSFAKSNKPFPTKALEYERKKNIEKKLLKWADDYNLDVIYK
jgi:hypothetical protein